MPAPETAEPEAENIPLNIVFEDDEIIVIDKPAGLVVHPAAGNGTGTLVNALIAHCGDSLSGIGGVKRPGIVHRLDKDTTGLMVVAKTDRAHRALPPSSPTMAAPARCGAAIWRSSGACRTGRRAPSTSRSTATRTPATGWRCAQGGREAITHWEVLERYSGHGRRSRWRACSTAGWKPAAPTRSGSISPIGHPLLGDDTTAPASRPRRTGSPPDAQAALEALGRQALHAYLLASNTDQRQGTGVPLGTAGRSLSFTS